MTKLIRSCLPIVVAMALFISGCGDSGGNDLSNLSGAWQNPSTKQKIQIDFSNNKTTITLGDTILPVTIKPLTSDTRVGAPLMVGDALPFMVFLSGC